MNIPSKIKYKDKMYDTVGVVTVNSSDFLIVKLENEVLKIDVNEKDGNLSFALVHDAKATNTISEHILIDYVIEAIKKDIENGKYQDKDELKKDLLDINNYINESKIGDVLKSADVKISQGNFMENVTSLLEFFDKKFEDKTSLDLKNLTSFKIDNVEYIKYVDEFNTVKILEDNVENRNFIDQFKAKQNEVARFQLEEGEKSADEIFDNIAKFEKTEVILNDNENTELGIAIQEDNTILKAEVEDDIVKVSKVGETSAEQDYIEKEIIDNTEKKIEVTIPSNSKENEDNPITNLLVANISQESFDFDDFIEQYKNEFIPEQIDVLLNNYPLTNERREELIELKDTLTKQVVIEKGFQKTLGVHPALKNAAFADSLILSFIVGAMCGIYLTYLIMAII